MIAVLIASLRRLAAPLGGLALAAGAAAQAASGNNALAEAAAARDRAGAAMLRGACSDAAHEADSCLSRLPAAAAALEGECALELGRARFQLGDPAGAAEALARAKGKLGLLEAHGAKLRGESLLLAGRAREAVAALREAAALGGSGPAGVEAAALLADALFDAGELDAAAAQARAAAGLAGQPPAVRAGLAWTRVRALAQLALGDAGRAEAGADAGPAASAEARARAAREAAEAARDFWRDDPDHPAAAGEPALEASLAAIAGGPLPEPSGRDRLTRAGHLLNAGQPALAAAEAGLARNLLSGDERAEASLLLARALAADGRRGEAGPALDEARRSGQPRIAAAAMLLFARDRSRRTESDAALALLDQLAARFPQSGEADEGALLAARLQLDAGKADDGRARLVRLAARHSASAADARWALAWLAFRAGQPDAGERFAACAALATDDESRARALYWQGRASAPSAAPPLYQRALELDPLGWYGLLARTALAAAPAPAPKGARKPAAKAAPARTARGRPAPAQPASASPLEALQAQIPEPARHLLQLGFSSEAAAELDRAAQEARGSLERQLPVLLGYQRCGRYDRSVPLAQTLLAGRPAPLEFRAPGRAALGAQDPSLRALLEAAYPAAFPEAISASARRSGLDPDFIRAVARRESVFKPDARSGAGAVGLLQLLPITARRAAAVLGRPAPADKELLDPAVAVDLGAWYLAELLGRFRDPAIAVAAYNAGPRAVAPWVKAGAGEPLDLFVEEIPFKETRRYVKVVIGAWSAYRLLHGVAPPALAATVPEAGSGTAF